MQAWSLLNAHSCTRRAATCIRWNVPALPSAICHEILPLVSTAGCSGSVPMVSTCEPLRRPHVAALGADGEAPRPHHPSTPPFLVECMFVADSIAQSNPP